MKIRTDFVSNSSSTSFIIDDCDKVKFKSIFKDVRLPWDISDRITVHFCYLRKYRTEIKKTLFGNRNYGRDWDDMNDYPHDWYDNEGNKHSYTPKPDDECYDSCELYHILDADDDILSKIYHLDIELDDNPSDSQRFTFRIIYEYLKKKGFKMNDDDTEHLIENGDFMDGCLKYLMSSRKKNTTKKV